MMDQITLLRRILRQAAILAGLTGLMIAAGIDWAHAATREASPTMLSELHAIVLFAATIAFLVRTAMPRRKPARTKSRRRQNRR